MEWVLTHAHAATLNIVYTLHAHAELSNLVWLSESFCAHDDLSPVFLALIGQIPNPYLKLCSHQCSHANFNLTYEIKVTRAISIN